MLEAGKLKHLLIQFRYDFADNAASRQHLTKIVQPFKDAFSLVVELRHKSWETPGRPELSAGPRRYRVQSRLSGIAAILQPAALHGRQAGYFRMHGRNAEKWFSKAGRDEVYNYLYNPQELATIKERLDSLGKAFESLTVIANNHYRGAELANAIELKALVSGQKQPVPEGLLKDLSQLGKNRI